MGKVSCSTGTPGVKAKDAFPDIVWILASSWTIVLARFRKELLMKPSVDEVLDFLHS